MPGVRRRLRDVGKKVTGALAGALDLADGSQAGGDPAEGAAPKDPAGQQGPAAQEEDATVLDAELVDEAGPSAHGAVPTDGPEPPLDELCAAAVELARGTAVELAGAAVGEHQGVEVAGERVVTHWFATTDRGYVGWRWAVVVARADGASNVTVDEVVLLPGPGALLAPAWLPWSERVQPGDLTPGDLLPPVPDDPRLVPGYADVDADPALFDLHRELGLGRPRVLSLEGRADAAERWYDGPAGPDSPMAKAAPGRCGECGFLTSLAGPLGRVFGACANAMAPDDGRVVALTHGCGAHSETVVEAVESSYAGMAVEDDEFDIVPTAGPEQSDLGTTQPDAGSAEPDEVGGNAESPVAEHSDDEQPPPAPGDGPYQGAGA